MYRSAIVLIQESEKVRIEKETVYVDALQKITKEEVVNNIENNIAKVLIVPNSCDRCKGRIVYLKNE